MSTSEARPSRTETENEGDKPRRCGGQGYRPVGDGAVAPWGESSSSPSPTFSPSARGLSPTRRQPCPLRAIALSPRDGLGRLQGAAAGEDRQPAEEDAARSGVSRSWLQAIASRKRPLAGGQVARAAGQQRQPAVEPGQQRRRRQEGDAGRRQLDGERQPVEAAADRGHGRRRCSAVRAKSGLHRPRSLDEEPRPPRTRPRSARAGGSVGRGSASGGTANAVLPGDAQGARGWWPARVSPAQAPSSSATDAAPPPRPARSCRAPAAAAGRAETPPAPRPTGRSPCSRTPQRLGDGRADEGGVAKRRQSDEEDAVGEASAPARRRRPGRGGSCRCRRGRSGSRGARRVAAGVRWTSAISRSRPISGVRGTGKGANASRAPCSNVGGCRLWSAGSEGAMRLSPRVLGGGPERCGAVPGKGGRARRRAASGSH